ncbi:MAG: tRNA adenosine(34) deaminase TadA [Myxococcota bacterium]
MTEDFLEVHLSQDEKDDIDDKDEYFMRLALAQARIAKELGEVPVGAIIVRGEKIIAQTHNRRELDKDPTAHAECLAIKAAAEYIGDWRLEHCTLYVTMEPCPMCAGALWLSRIERCVYGCADPRAGFLGSISNLMEHQELNHHYKVSGGVLAEECANELKTFFRQIREQRKEAKKDK